MSDALQGAVEDVMDGQIRELCGQIYARVRPKTVAHDQDDIEQLRTRIRTAIDTWRSTDLATPGDTRL